MKISVIIPFLNEEENIHSLVTELNLFFAEEKNYEAEVLFINDGSADRSVELLKASRHTAYKGKVISLSKNFGSHAALRAGIREATGDLICFMYADLQDPLNLISRLFEKCSEGNEIAWAVRNNTENGFFESSFSKFYSAMMQKYAISTYPDKGFDVVMFSKKIQQNINSNVEANSSIFLQILTLGYKQVTIGYDKKTRTKGKSKWTLSKKVKLFIDSFVAFSYAPIRFVTVIGILLFITGITWSAYLIIRKLAYNDLESGWPALMSVLLTGFGITNISLGIIAEYLWRTLDASRKRPVYIIDEIIELKNE
ncbi:MAG TPA: glycosyltransferase [Bacteroidia bacterium]|jgi:dolichol-phosphate mannosyltransferase